MQAKFQDLLHRHKVQVFRAEHEPKNVEQLTTECLHITEDVLKQKFHYHFKSLPDANRGEIINMIQSYVREAILPPVVERLVERQLKFEHRLQAVQQLLTELLEVLSHDSDRAPALRR
ncbi:MAG: hypothetical protein FJ293_05075 [Planctomycetes bacterium]|nr:hypothetical protein [Planctomycetota bacterium]